MVKRLIFAVVGVVGVVLIGLAIASATVWRADDVLRASASAAEPIVVTDPGVLEMAGDPVTITATVPEGGRVVLAVGRDTDVSGWVGSDPHERVSGLAGWHTLAFAAPEPAPPASSPASPSPGASASATPAASASPEPSASAGAAADAGADGAVSDTAAPPDATDSDMWVARTQGTGSATLTWQAQPGRWSLLVVGATAAGAGAPPTVEMAWPRTVTTPYLVPGSVAGGLLLLAGLWLLWRDLRRARHADEWTPVLTEPIPVVGSSTGAGPALTRRQMRELQALAIAAQRRRHAPLTGEVTAVPEAPQEPARNEQSANRGAPAHDEPAAPSVAAVHQPAHRGLPAHDEPSRTSAVPTGDTEPVTSPVSVSRRALRAAAAAAAAAAGRASGPATGSEAPPEAGRTAQHPPGGGSQVPSEPVSQHGQPVPGWASHVADRPVWAPGRPSGPAESSGGSAASRRGRTTSADAARSSSADQALSADGARSADKAQTGPDAGEGHPSWLPGDGSRHGRAGRTAWPPIAVPGPAPDEGSAAEHGADAQRGDALRTEVSRADAWRRAWGLPPSDSEEDR